MLDRRSFLRRGATAAGLAFFDLNSGSAQLPLRDAAGRRDAGAGWIDVNVNLSRWPMRRVHGDETPDLVARLRAAGVTRAWAGSFDGLLHKDIGAVNERLAADCRRHGKGVLVPFGSINPQLPDWEEDLRRCALEHRMPGIRLHPNYHGYRLEAPVVPRLLRLAAQRDLIVQLAVEMEDERMMHPLLRVEPVGLEPLPRLVRETPGLRLVLLNALRTLRGDLLARLMDAETVCLEISMLEGVAGVENLLKQTPLERVLFGSHAPFFYFEAAALKLRESDLTAGQLAAIKSGNARRLLTDKRLA